MKGKISITIFNNVLQYKIELRRNITIIKGDSATGKTTLVDMVREFYDNGEDSGVNLQCEVSCVVLEGKQWKKMLEDIHSSVVFIDEGNRFVVSDEFASAVRESDNYFVIVTREYLPNLPYSIEEIYGIKTSGKYGRLGQIYQELYQLYGDYKRGDSFYPEVVLVEDTNSGFEFFDVYSKNKDWITKSAGGKSNIFGKIKELQGKRLLIVADGAAFGSEMERVMQKVSVTNQMMLYLPESFEWLILKSGLVEEHDIRDIIDDPSRYIDSEKYMSWERYFTALLVERTKDTYLRYSKNKLNDAYKNSKVLEKIIGQIPEGIM